MNELQPLIIIAIYGDIQGYSSVVMGADWEKEVNLYLLYENTNINGISQKRLQNNLQELQQKYPINKVLVNTEDIHKLIATYAEEREIKIESSSLNLMSLYADKRIKFGQYADIFQRELENIDLKTNISHRLNALFLGLSYDFRIQYALQNQFATNHELDELEELSKYFPVYGEPRLPKNYEFKHDWF